MAKRSKQALAELDAALDQLGGGAAPVPRPRRRAVKSSKKAGKKAVGKKKR
jgi:hypothetical protein